MAISIAPNSARITNITRPTPNQPRIYGTQATFDSVAMRADGEVTLNGNAGDSTSGWKIGWIQAQWIETNWCIIAVRLTTTAVFSFKERIRRRVHSKAAEIRQDLSQIF